MSWIAGHRVENSPSWRTAHEVTDALVPDLHSPWFSRLAWTNLYPIAPGDYKGNPAWSEPKFRGVKSVTGTFPGAWVRMEDGAELSRITEWEVLPGSTTVDVEHNRSFAILFGDAEFDVTALWSDRTKGAMSAVDLSMTTDLVQGVIDSFSPDFA